MNLPKLILASGSPRRVEILNSVGWAFKKEIPDVDETQLKGEEPGAYVRRLCEAKAAAVSGSHPGKFVLGADTTVVIDDQILGKPDDVEHADTMIRTLSGRWHEVLTGVAIVRDARSMVGLQRTRVKFAELSDTEIKFLVEYGEPLDKAGAYAVQAQAALFIEQIDGDYWNVVGLPISMVYRLVMEFGPSTE